MLAGWYIQYRVRSTPVHINKISEKKDASSIGLSGFADDVESIVVGGAAEGARATDEVEAAGAPIPVVLLG